MKPAANPQWLHGRLKELITKTPFWRCYENSRPVHSAQAEARILDCNVYHSADSYCNSLCIDIDGSSNQTQRFRTMINWPDTVWPIPHKPPLNELALDLGTYELRMSTCEHPIPEADTSQQESDQIVIEITKLRVKQYTFWSPTCSALFRTLQLLHVTRLEMMHTFLRDFRYALRQLRKSPGFTFTVVLMLALGIGANTAVFSVMNAVLMQLLPVSRPEGLSYVRMPNGQHNPGGAQTGAWDTSFSEPVFEALRQHSDVFEELVAYVPLSFTGSIAVRHGELPEEASGEEVSGNFFSGVGARLEHGRGFSLQDEKNHAPIVVLSYEYWTRSYARDPAVVGQTLYIKGVPMTVVGVAAHGFKGIEPASSTDFWVPLQNRPELNAWGTPADNNTLYGSPNWWCLRMMARLHSGVTPMQAQQAITGTYAEVVKQTIGTVDPKQWKPLLEFVPARGIGGYNDQYREPLRILMGLVVLVLLIACANVAMMVQARNTMRQREFSLRLAIGAGRAAIFRQLLCESLLLVSAGAALGWIFALSATRMLATMSRIETGLSPRSHRTILYTAGLDSSRAGLWPHSFMERHAGAGGRSTARDLRQYNYKPEPRPGWTHGTGRTDGDLSGAADGCWTSAAYIAQLHHAESWHTGRGAAGFQSLSAGADRYSRLLSHTA
jgi:hypothetical protein